MKIMHVCLAAFYIDNYSYQENILPRMHREMGHEVMILASTETFTDGINLGYVEPREYLNEDNIEVHRIPYKYPFLGKVAKKLRVYKNVYAELEKFKPDIIFLHDVQFISIKDIVRYVKKNTNVAIVADGHADFSNSARGGFSKNILHKVIYKRCAQMILPYTKKYYGTLPARVEFFKNVYDIPADKVEFLPMGVDDDMAEQSRCEAEINRTKNSFGIDEGDFVIVTGGKIDYAKTQTLLLMKAVNMINNPRVKMLIFGSVTDELKEEFEGLCSSQIRYAGWANVRDSYKYFAIADLVVFPGRHSVYWEQAAGQGKPMLVKFWEGTTHVDLGGNVRFLYKDSVEEISSVLCDVIDNEVKYAEMLRIAQDKGMEMFSYRNIAKRCIKDI